MEKVVLLILTPDFTSSQTKGLGTSRKKAGMALLIWLLISTTAGKKNRPEGRLRYT